VALWTVLTLVAAVASSITTRDDRLGRQRRTVEAMLAAGPRDPTVMSIGAPQPLVLGHLTNPSQHQMFHAGLTAYVDDTYPGGLAGFVDFIHEERPTYLTLDSARYYPWLTETLEEDYARVGTTSGYVWFVRNDVDGATIERLKATSKRSREAARRERGEAVK
jgi:hypothetical protein